MTTPRTRPILIVDDDPDAVALTKHALAKAGIKTQIDVMENGECAIAYLKEKLAEGDHALPLLLFLDLKMPGTDGFQLIEPLRRKLAGHPTLFAALTGHGREEDEARAFAAGFDSFLVKPLQPDGLSRLLRSYASKLH